MGSQNAPGDYKTLVLQSTDIVDLIGQSVSLTRRGKDFLGLCPFHQDKNPSFYVVPSKQIFHCFACKATGNAIDFVMKRDRVEFMEAIRILAERAGIELPHRGQDAGKAGERAMLVDAHSAACGFFESHLQSAAGAAARAYLEKRGFTAETLRKFRIGLAPDAWDGLLRSPAMRKFPPAVLALGGLVKPRQSGDGHYDTFRNRIMFPIFEEAQARIIAFGGRVMPGSDDNAKYLNSPETPLFSKSRCLFGLNFARDRMIETGVSVVVEGYTDVIASHQFGATNVVSPLGTSLTEQHVNILRRFAGKIVLLFDPDEAGDRAVDRAVELFLSQDIEIAVATLPDAVDPDEFLLARGLEAFDAVIRDARDVLSYKWTVLARQFQASAGDLTGQKKAVEAYLGLLASARGAGPVDPLRWGAALARVSRLTEIPVDDLHRRFKAKPAAPRSRQPASPLQSAVQEHQSDAIVPVVEIPRAREVAERQIMGILLKEPRRWQLVQVRVHPEDFASPGCRKISQIYWHHQLDEGEPVFNEFIGNLQDPEVKLLAVELWEMAEGLPDVEATLTGALAYLEEERRRAEEQKQLAELRRISQQSGQQDEAGQQFAKFLKNNQSSDPRRLGPVRRGSGS